VNPPKMPIHIGDLLRDTGHLRAMLMGAYLLLLFHHWSAGELPDDDEQLSAISRLTPSEWRKARPILERFFQPGWKHGRVEKDLASARESYEKRAKAGEKGGKAKAEIKQSSSNATAKPEQPLTLDHLPDTKEENSSLRSEAAPAKPKAPRAKPKHPLPDLWQLDEEDFTHAREAGFAPEKISEMASSFLNHHRAKGSLMADWHAAWRTWCSNEIKFHGGQNAAGTIRTNQASGPAATRDTAVIAGMGRALARRREARAADDQGREELRERGGAGPSGGDDPERGSKASDDGASRQLTLIPGGYPRQ